jgi:hypothetical protein
MSGGSPAFVALLGLGWGALLIANYYLVQVQAVRFTTLATLVISLAMYPVAGLLAAAQTGAISTGLLAGLWAGLFSSLLNAVGVMIILLTDHTLLERLLRGGQNFVHVSFSGPGSPTVETAYLIYTAITLVGGILLATLVGLALGALGGSIGESRAPRGPALHVYQESMYPGIPPAPPAGVPGASSPPSPGVEKP